MVELSKIQNKAVATPEDITSDIEEFAATPTGQFVILSKASDAVYTGPQRETPEYFGGVEITDMDGDTYAVSFKAFEASYDRFRRNDGTTFYAAKALGNDAAQTEAFINMAATVINKPRTNTSTELLSLATDSEMQEIRTISQRAISIGARDDCSLNKLAA